MQLIRWALPAWLAVCSVAAADEPHPGAGAFVERVQAEHGLDAERVRRVLAEARFRQDIIDAITRPAEDKPWHEYREIFMTEARIGGGVEFWRANRELLEAVSESYRVPIEIIVAIVGIETNYGVITGSHRVIDALVTLGFYYPRRADFFADELAHYLRLTEEEGLTAEEIRGSYAGAMGLGQFIPSSYRAYAVDFDDSGHRDLWRSLPDALASVANYLSSHGWRMHEPIVLAVEDSPGIADFEYRPKPEHTLGELEANGWRPVGHELPADTPVMPVRLELADGHEYRLGLNNFHVITRYNRSPLYAMAVTELASAIRERSP